MSYRQITAQRLDIIVGARILNGCWFITSVGIAIFQMRLLAQVWQETHQAVWTACIVSSWMLGSVLISRLGARKLRAPRLWGVGFVICSFIGLDVSLSLHLFSLPFHFTIVVGLGTLILMAWLLGMMSTAWLVQRRPWPPVDERTSLAKGLMSTMIGLCLVWVFPAWAGSLGLVCLSPLLVLDFWPQAQCPLPLPGKVVDSWYDTSAGADRWQVQLRRRRLPLSWWWSYLTQRGYVSLIFLASSVSVILGGLWSAVPTPFASGLAGTHTVWLLEWLVVGQLVALSIGFCGVMASRGVLGPVDRLIPQVWQFTAWLTAIAMVGVMAGSLLTLGLPFLQAPWSLAASLSIYTLAGTIWGILLPRLKPNLSTVVFAQRHLMFGQGNVLLGRGQLAYERAQEEFINRLLLTMEGILTALIAPGIGWLVDRWGVDNVLIASGLFLFMFLGLWLLVIGLVQAIGYNMSSQA